jgi:lysyl-tRNA synthetase class I
MEEMLSNSAMRILITGSTTWTDADALRREFKNLPAGSTIVTGDTPGVDTIAETLALEIGFKIERMKKNEDDYRIYPQEAWKRLNERMIETKIDLVFAFSADFYKEGRARGTRHAVELAQEQGIPVRIFLA